MATDAELMLHKLCDEEQCQHCAIWFPKEEGKRILDLWNDSNVLILTCSTCFVSAVRFLENEIREAQMEVDEQKRQQFS